MQVFNLPVENECWGNMIRTGTDHVLGLNSHTARTDGLRWKKHISHIIGEESHSKCTQKSSHTQPPANNTRTYHTLKHTEDEECSPVMDTRLVCAVSKKEMR